jgi:hypothetical protein
MHKRKDALGKFLRTHAEAALATLALLFIVVIVAFLYATIHAIVPQIDRALVTPVAPPLSGFNLDAASRINYHGLVQGGQTSTISATQSPSSAVSASTTASGTAYGAPAALATTSLGNATTAH